MATTAQIQRTIKEIDRLLAAHTKVQAETESPERKKLVDAINDTAKALDKALAAFKELPSHNGNDGNWEKLVAAMGKYRQAKYALERFDTPADVKAKEQEERQAHLKRLEKGQKETGYSGEERRGGDRRDSGRGTPDRRMSGSAVIAHMTALSNEVLAEAPSDVFSDIYSLIKKGKEKYFPPRAIKILKLKLEEANDHLDDMVKLFKTRSGDNNVLKDVVVALRDYQTASARYAIAMAKRAGAAPAAKPVRPARPAAQRPAAQPESKSMWEVDLSKERTASVEARLEQTYRHIVKTGKLPL